MVADVQFSNNFFLDKVSKFRYSLKAMCMLFYVSEFQHSSSKGVEMAAI
jgi:hypothetical protein